MEPTENKKLPALDTDNVNAPTDEIREEHRYFERDGKHLFCAEYLPTSPTKGGVILCAPFAEEKIRTLRIYVSLARLLARSGLATLCFDYYGDGDSEGNFEDASFEDRQSNITAVYQDFQKRHELDSVGLLGLRWGGTLAALTAEKLNPAFLVLWEPVVDTSKYFFDHLRSYLATEMLVDGKISRKRDELVEYLSAGNMLTVEGYNLTGDFFTSARANGLKDQQLTYSGPTLVVQLAGNPARIRPELEQLTEIYKRGQLQAMKREFEWEKTERWRPAPPELFGLTLDFLKTNELC